MERLKDGYESAIRKEFDVIKRCTVHENGRTILLATFPESRYPYFYLRDSAAAARLFKLISDLDFSFSEEAYNLLKSTARFTLSVQREDGYWGQRYSTDGADKTIYIQEDNVAHGMIIIANYILASLKRGIYLKDLNDYITAFNRAALYALNHYFRREINLFFSTTSIHESAIERGYSIWVNYAYLRAFRRAEEIHNRLEKTEISEKILGFIPYFERNINKLLIHNGRYIRRITPEGDYDYKPDVTLLSPYYFGFEEVNSDALRNTVDFMANHLWDPELGMLQRYLPFTEDFHTHIHAGNGPWLNYTAMLAQYYYRINENRLADKIMDEIDRFRTEDGYIPEHLSTYKRFEEFMRLEWNTGFDYQKEFYREILVPNVSFDIILEELNNMKRGYDAIKTRQKTLPDKHIVFAAPLMWSHVEYARALYVRMRGDDKVSSQ